MDEEVKGPIATFYAWDQDDLDRYSHAVGYYLALWRIREDIHRFLKYGHTFKTADEAMEGIRDSILGAIEDYHLPEE